MALSLCVDADSIETRLGDFDGLIGEVDCEEKISRGELEPNGHRSGKILSAAKLDDKVSKRLAINENSRCMVAFEFTIDF